MRHHEWDGPIPQLTVQGSSVITFLGGWGESRKKYKEIAEYQE
jgi:hypothetical protein